MKYYRSIPFILALLLVLSSCKTTENLKEQINDVDGELSYSDVMKESPDEKLVRAFVESDTKTIDEMMNSGEKGEMIDLIRAYEPFVKIRTYKDIQKASCLPSKACKKPHETTEENLESCANGKSFILQNDINDYPGCELEIREFYITTALCMLQNYQDMCVEEDVEYLRDDPKEREQERLRQAQNSYNCMTKFMRDPNARTNCITNTPRFSEAELDKEILDYCRQAVECKAFNNTDTCVAKYKGFFAKDKSSYHDCTNQHVTSMIFEFRLLDYMIKNEDAKNHNLCENISDYENFTIHIEELMDKSNSVDEYNAYTLEVNNKAIKDPNHEKMLSWTRIGLYMSDETYSKIENKQEVYDKTTDYRKALNYYSACRISNFNAKK